MKKQDNTPPSLHRFGFITLAGPPNAGKSTLLNRIVGEKISIISRRPQTTRHRICGIKTLPDAQFVFVDTPGIHSDEKKNLNRVINKTAVSSLNDVDLILFMIDTRGWNEQLEKTFKHVRNTNTPVILLINKVDQLKDKSQLLPLINESMVIFDFKEIIPISAISLDDVPGFLASLVKHLSEGPPGFPDDQVTDRSERFLASELIREQTFLRLGQELPYSMAVQITKYEYKEKHNRPILHIDATLWVEKPGQKSIVIGKGGGQLKLIGQHARKQIEYSLGCQVFLTLWVKVTKGWAENASLLQSLGYSET
ncbi:MAG: GTPase Era [Gammaproteobacteria bacterium]|nr:GTPase Era [Gammaproteobacteria bacterium]